MDQVLMLITHSMTMAPKTEVYIRLVCAQYRPEFLQPPALPVPREGHWALPLPLNPPTALSYPPRPDESLIPVKAADPLITFDKGFRVHVPRPSSKCTSDPEVGQIVAGLNTAVTLTLGILSLITTGYWTSVGCLGDLVMPFLLTNVRSRYITSIPTV